MVYSVINMKIRAAILREQNKPLTIEDVETPSLKPGQVLVKILVTGICQTQINEMKGIKGEDKFLPHLMGHEASGEIVEIGEGVSKVKPGDFVVLSWIKGEGQDVASAQYKQGENIVNSGAITTFNTYSVISENRIIPVDNSIPADIAALLGCAVPTGAGVIKNTMNAKSSDTIAIFGLGGVGLSALLYAKYLGCSVIAVDISSVKLEFAKSLGADFVINSGSENPVEKIKQITSTGADFALESSGVPKVMEQAFESIKFGGTAVLAGNVRAGEKIGIDPYGLINHKKIFGTWGGETDTDRDIPHYAQIFKQGKFPIDKLITHTFKLEDVNEAFEEIQKGTVGRAIIKLGDVNGK